MGIIKALRDSAVLHKMVTSVVILFQYCHYGLSRLLNTFVKPIIQRSFKKIACVTVESAADMDPKDKDCKRNPWDIVVKNDAFYAKLAAYNTLGLADSYIDGWWDTEDAEELFCKLLSNDVPYKILDFPQFSRFLEYIRFGFFNMATAAESSEVGKHYDETNELFQKTLDKTMTMSCAFWKNVSTLEDAQISKMELVAQKLKLKPGMRVLDLGCGFGTLSEYLARKYKVHMVGCTLEAEGAKYGSKMCKGLPVEIHTCDYREIKGKFDRIVTIEMLEHIGARNYKTFFEHLSRLLKDGGILLVQCVGVNDNKVSVVDGWMNTYFAPGLMFPYPENICNATDGLFVIEDWHNMGYNYHLTFKSWHESFIKNWPNLKKNCEEPEKFYRMWTYNLQMLSAYFKTRKMQLWQVVFSKNGLEKGYDAPR